MTTPSTVTQRPVGPPFVQPTKAQARRALTIWTCVIVGLLGLQIGLCAVGVIIATRTNPPVVKDYYSKAVHWDDRNRPAAGKAPDASAGEKPVVESRP